jgi:hypothetical protein
MRDWILSAEAGDDMMVAVNIEGFLQFSNDDLLRPYDASEPVMSSARSAEPTDRTAPESSDTISPPMSPKTSTETSPRPMSDDPPTIQRLNEMRRELEIMRMFDLEANRKSGPSSLKSSPENVRGSRGLSFSRNKKLSIDPGVPNTSEMSETSAIHSSTEYRKSMQRLPSVLDNATIGKKDQSPSIALTNSVNYFVSGGNLNHSESMSSIAESQQTPISPMSPGNTFSSKINRQKFFTPSSSFKRMDSLRSLKAPSSPTSPGVSIISVSGKNSIQDFVRVNSSKFLKDPISPGMKQSASETRLSSMSSKAAINKSAEEPRSVGSKGGVHSSPSMNSLPGLDSPLVSRKGSSVSVKTGGSKKNSPDSLPKPSDDTRKTISGKRLMYDLKNENYLSESKIEDTSIKTESISPFTKKN